VAIQQYSLSRTSAGVRERKVSRTRWLPPRIEGLFGQISGARQPLPKYERTQRTKTQAEAG